MGESDRMIGVIAICLMALIFMGVLCYMSGIISSTYIWTKWFADGDREKQLEIIEEFKKREQ